MKYSDGTFPMDQVASFVAQDLKVANKGRAKERLLHPSQRADATRLLLGSARQYALRRRLFSASRNGDLEARALLFEYWGVRHWVPGKKS